MVKLPVVFMFVSLFACRRAAEAADEANALEAAFNSTNALPLFRACIGGMTDDTCNPPWCGVRCVNGEVWDINLPAKDLQGSLQAAALTPLTALRYV